LTDARHVRNAVARFDQVTGVTKAERDLAFANVKRAARYYGIDLSESSAKDLPPRPQRGRKKAAKKAVATRKRRPANSGARKAARSRAKTRKR
jgi:hypothetical protein